MSPSHSKLTLGTKRANSIQLPEIALSPQTSSRTIFGTQRKSEIQASRNVLDQMVAKTSKVANSKVTLHKVNHFTEKTGGSTPKVETSAKKAKLRALLDKDEKQTCLEVPRFAPDFN